MTASSSEEHLPPKTSPSRGFLARLRDDVDLTHAALPILACCTVSGLCDSVAFNATGTFASMQTGNTIFLALGAAHLPANQPHLWLRALVSILSFQLGCLFFSQIRRFRPQSKLTLSLSFLSQSLLIFLTAILASTRTIPAFSRSQLPTVISDPSISAPGGADSELSLIALGLLAFQFGGQIVMSRVLGVNEVPTNVLTSLYCDLLSDPGLLMGVGKNQKRDRRVGSIVLLVGGGIVGGWLQRSRGGMGAALWIAGGIKLMLAVGWLGWRGREVKEKDGRDGVV